MQYLPDGFLQMIFIDTEWLRISSTTSSTTCNASSSANACLVFDARRCESGKGRFRRRIWVEDQGFNCRRFNGSYNGGGPRVGIQFDSWRTNVQPGIWLRHLSTAKKKIFNYALSKKLDFKAQTRIWGTTLATPRRNRNSQDPVEGPRTMKRPPRMTEPDPGAALRGSPGGRQRCGPLATHRLIAPRAKSTKFWKRL